MISVILPAYNRADFLEQALASVQAQTLACGEILLIDDGSTDDSKALVLGLARQSTIEIRYIRQEHQGVSAARNRGISEARYDLLAFLDSDDQWAPCKLELQLAAMEQAPRYLISHTRERWFRQGRQVNQKKKHAPPQGNIFFRALGMCVVGMSTVMARRELFSRYGLFDPALPCCEDYDLWLRVSRAEEFLLVDEPLTLKNGGRPDQLSVQHRLGMDVWRIRAICGLLDQHPLQPDQQQAALAELRRKCTIYGKGCIKHGRIAEGEQYLALPDQYAQ